MMMSKVLNPATLAGLLVTAKYVLLSTYNIMYVYVFCVMQSCYRSRTKHYYTLSISLFMHSPIYISHPLDALHVLYIIPTYHVKYMR